MTYPMMFNGSFISRQDIMSIIRSKSNWMHDYSERDRAINFPDFNPQTHYQWVELNFVPIYPLNDSEELIWKPTYNETFITKSIDEDPLNYHLRDKVVVHFFPKPFDHLIEAKLYRYKRLSDIDNAVYMTFCGINSDDSVEKRIKEATF